MKLLSLVFLLAAVAPLAGCADLWMATYRAKGGYYDRPTQQTSRP